MVRLVDQMFVVLSKSLQLVEHVELALLLKFQIPLRRFARIPHLHLLQLHVLGINTNLTMFVITVKHTQQFKPMVNHVLLANVATTKF